MKKLFVFLLFVVVAYSFADGINERNVLNKSVSDSSAEGLQIPTPPDETESICGDTVDWQDVELYDGTLGPSVSFVMDHEGAVGQVQWNDDLATLYADPGNVNAVRWCTGTLIADDLFLTAGHCFDVQVNDGSGWDFPVDDTTGLTISSEEAALNMHINLDYQYDSQGLMKTAVPYRIVNLLEYREGGVDYAIAQLESTDAGQTFGTTGVSADIPEMNDLLTIIQHPNGIPKVIDAGLYDGLETSGSLPGYMRYVDLDTSGGSSGSGVLDDSGNIVAVHTNAGCTSSGGANHGVPINTISAQSPIIQGMLAASSDQPDLVISDISIDNPTILYGATPWTWIHFEVENVGNGDVSGLSQIRAISVNVTKDGVPFPTSGYCNVVISDPFEPGDTATHRFAVGHESSYFTPGVYTLQMEVDSNDMVDESNENNNLSSVIQFEIVERQADLVVDNIYIDSPTIVYGATPWTWIHFRVKNVGSDDIEGLDYIRGVMANVTKNGEPFYTSGYFNIVVSDPFEPGDTATHQFAVGHAFSSFTPGVYTLQVRVDSNNMVDEFNENNNLSDVIQFEVVSP